MNYGVIQMGRGNYPVADQYFERALQLTPRYAYLQVNIAILKAALGHPDEAERHFRDALRDDPNNPVSYTYFARWLGSIGRTEEARLLAERAAQLSPADADAMALVADLQTSRLASHSAETEPHTPEEWLSLGLAQCNARRYEACIRFSEHVLQWRPDSAEAFNNICAAENALGNYGSATDACERALAIRPRYTVARNNLAVAKARGAK